MLKRFCDICGYEMEIAPVLEDGESKFNDENREFYGPLVINISVPLSNNEKEVGVEDICVGCKKRLNQISPTRFLHKIKEIIRNEALEEDLPF